MKKESKKTFTITLPEFAIKQLKQESKLQGVSCSVLILMAIKKEYGIRSDK